MPFVATSSPKCNSCTKSVYPMESLTADELTFHKNCFRCKFCSKMLSTGNYASMSGEYFCKPCFKKTFLEKGNYSEGFGKLKPQQEFEAGKPSGEKKQESEEAPEPQEVEEAGAEEE